MVCPLRMDLLSTRRSFSFASSFLTPITQQATITQAGWQPDWLPVSSTICLPRHPQGAAEHSQITQC